MSKFSKGDTVVCVNDNLSSLKLGTHYTVEKVLYFCGEWGVVLEQFPNNTFYPDRFIKTVASSEDDFND